ncbi:hypothetical protein HYU11_04695 [Candidatus Woesearchaeota archaeon]|nr:hypothetical protein [Candidatus Woesearchaeota archaeon]
MSTIRLIMALAIIISMSSAALAMEPTGPVITQVRNETAIQPGSTILNTTGGSISTIDINGTQQNLRWKGYVGNVSGKLTLDDANNNTIFDWSIGAASGEVFATRNPGSVNWSGINCSNSTHLSTEDINMNHTNPSDNITRTFSQTSHSEMYVSTNLIRQNSCYSLKTYVNDAPQSSVFEEIVLYDGTNLTNGNTVYATKLEQDSAGFDGRTYDFQMIVPEIGAPSWRSSTAYYFYVEIT